jgi:hypothetical protein
LLRAGSVYADDNGIAFSAGDSFNLFHLYSEVYAECSGTCLHYDEVHLLLTPAVAHPFSYTGDGIAASGVFYTLNAENADGFFQVTAVIGTRNGVAMTLLAPNSYPYDVTNNNGLREVGPYLLDSAGISFSAGEYFNLYRNIDGSFSECHGTCDYLQKAYYVPPRVTLSFGSEGGAVPEPASWALMLMGFGGLGAALRRRRALVAA